LGDVAIDTTSPASLAQRKARKDFRVALAPSDEAKYGGFLLKSAKKNGVMSQQSNTTSVVIKALQHGRAKSAQASSRRPRDDGRDKASSERDSCGAGDGSRSSASKWIQSDARFNMHQRRRLLLQQLL
jgi:hypothetical protein